MADCNIRIFIFRTIAFALDSRFQKEISWDGDEYGVSFQQYK